MKKYDKEVQKAFLNNEEAVIKELSTVYNDSLGRINNKISKLDLSIADLQKALVSVDDDDIGDLARAYLGSKKEFTPAEARATLQSMIQSKVYQKNYQNALKKQVGDILDKMHDAEFKTISDYLTECYDNGYIGAMYAIQQQGIPLCIPIDQTAVVRAVQLDSKISKGLYSHLGENVGELKKHIAAEVSRGVATGMSYKQVAQLIKAKMVGNYTDVPGGALHRAVTIARTEGHRVQTQSAMNAAYNAKEKGADVLKQWDAALDARTRDSHAMVDGEIRELDKPFSNGLMFPGDPSGGAAEVVNCRCALLQRARWALDDAELETLKERAAFFGLDKTKNFEDYKKKYLKASEDLTKSVNNGKIVQTTFDSFKLTGIDDDYAPDIEETFNGLMRDYPVKGLSVKTNRASDEFGHYSGNVIGKKKNGEQYAVWNSEICISKTSYKDKATSTDEHIYNYKHRNSALQNAKRADLATIPHEYAHAIDSAYVLAKDNILRDFAEQYKTAKKISVQDIREINDFNKILSKSDMRLSKEIFDELQKEYGLSYFETIDRIDKEYGSYASSSISEFLAEGFANMRILDDKDKTDFMRSFETIFNRKFNEVLGG